MQIGAKTHLGPEGRGVELELSCTLALKTCLPSFIPLYLDEFYCEEGDDGFVDETDNNIGQKEANLLKNLLDEDSLGQLTAVHNKYHQLKCQLSALRGNDPNKPGTSLDLIQGDLVDTIVNFAQEPEISVTSPTNNQRIHSKGKLRQESCKESTRERANKVKEIKQRAIKARANTNSGSLRYLNTSPGETKPEQDQPIANRKRGRPQKTIPKAKAPKKRQALEDWSDDDAIEGIISATASNATTKRAIARKAKKKAHTKLTWLSHSNHDSDDEEIEESDGDEYDVEEEFAEMRADRRSFLHAAKPVKRVSLAKAEGGNQPMSEETTTTISSSMNPTRNHDRIMTTCNDSQSNFNHSKDSTDPQTKVTIHVVYGDDENSPMSPESTAVLNSSSYKKTTTTEKKPKIMPTVTVVVPTLEESVKIELKGNDLIALRPLPKYRERPLVAKTIAFTPNFVHVKWYMGGYTTKWVEWKTGKAADKKVEIEKLSRENVLMTGFNFTSNNKLPIKIAKTLKKMYEQL